VFPLFKRPRSKRVTNETVADDVRSEPGELYCTEQYEVGNKFPRSAITVVTGELGITVPMHKAQLQARQWLVAVIMHDHTLATLVAHSFWLLPRDLDSLIQCWGAALLSEPMANILDCFSLNASGVR